MNDVEIILTGNAGDTPQLWENTPRAFSRLNVACTPRFRQEGEWKDAPTQWVQVKTWGKLAENTALSIRKGDAVIVKGTYRMEEYTNPEGVVYKTAVIFASAVGFDLRRTRAVAVNVRTDDADSCGPKEPHPKEETGGDEAPEAGPQEQHVGGEPPSHTGAAVAAQGMGSRQTSDAPF